MKKYESATYSKGRKRSNYSNYCFTVAKRDNSKKILSMKGKNLCEASLKARALTGWTTHRDVAYAGEPRQREEFLQAVKCCMNCSERENWQVYGECGGGDRVTSASSLLRNTEYFIFLFTPADDKYDVGD